MRAVVDLLSARAVLRRGRVTAPSCLLFARKMHTGASRGLRRYWVYIKVWPSGEATFTLHVHAVVATSRILALRRRLNFPR